GQSPSRPRRPRGSKAEQAPDRRLVVDQLILGRLGNPVGAYPEIAQLRGGDQIVEKLRAALQLSEVIWVQDDRLDVLCAVALDDECLAGLRLGRAHIVALDRRAMQDHVKKIAAVSDGTFSKSYETGA